MLFVSNNYILILLIRHSRRNNMYGYVEQHISLWNKAISGEIAVRDHAWVNSALRNIV